MAAMIYISFAEYTSGFLTSISHYQKNRQQQRSYSDNIFNFELTGKLTVVAAS